MTVEEYKQLQDDGEMIAKVIVMAPENSRGHLLIEAGNALQLMDQPYTASLLIRAGQKYNRA